MDSNLTPGVAPVIALDGVGKTYPLYSSLRERVIASLWRHGRPAPTTHKALNDVSLTVTAGETVGILGVNGAGKSTLLQIITGVLTPTTGRVEVNGRIAALLELGAGFNPLLTGRQNATFQCRLEGMAVGELPGRLAEIEAFADIGYYFDQPMRTYSSGMFIRVAFAAAISTNPDILIVDEALAVGDGRFQNKCYRRFEEMQQAGKTILVVTHSPEIVTRFCTRGIVLDHGRLVFDGSAQRAVEAYLPLLYVTPAGEAAAPPGGEIEGLERAVPAASETSQSRDKQSVLGYFPPDAAGDRLSQRPHYNPTETRFGNGRARVIDAAILLAGAEAPMYVEGRPELEIAIQARVFEHITTPSIGVIFKNVGNAYIFGTETELRGNHIGPVEAGDVISAVIRFRADVAPGDYFLDLGISDRSTGDPSVCDWRVSALHISLSSPVNFFGMADLGGEFSYVVQPGTASGATSMSCRLPTPAPGA